jgi:predicted TIM-barrel fold metal-dependent hydrolase
MKIIDAHNHPDWHGKDLNRFIQDMDEKGIDKCWLLSWECPRSEYHDGTPSVVSGPLLGTTTGPIPFSRCVSYAERAPERFILGYAPDARDQDACRKLIAAHEIYNAKICGEVKWRMMYNDFDCLRLFRTAGMLKMPVVMHFGYDFQYSYEDRRREWFGGSIDTLEDLLRSCPETTFIGHAPGFWVHISDDDLWRSPGYEVDNVPVVKEGKITKLLRKYPNLYCDISAGSGLKALTRDPEHAIEFLTEFQDRVLYARDCFTNAHREFLNSLGLSEKILAKIYGENAEALVK